MRHIDHDLTEVARRLTIHPSGEERQPPKGWQPCGECGGAGSDGQTVCLGCDGFGWVEVTRCPHCRDSGYSRSKEVGPNRWKLQRCACLTAAAPVFSARSETSRRTTPTEKGGW